MTSWRRMISASIAAIATISCAADEEDARACEPAPESEEEEAAPAAPATPPNVVVLLTDDQTLESMRVLERVRSLIGEQGMTFANAVVNYATCCPSRATLLTGQHAVNHGVRWNAPPTGGFQNFQDQETALPVALCRAGYRTVHVGKYLNGYGFFGDDRVTPPGWSDFEGLLSPSDAIYYDYSIWDDGEVITYGGGSGDYQTDVLTERALEEIDEALEADEAFFLQLAYLAPHAASGTPVGEFDLGELVLSDDVSTWPTAIAAPRHEGLFDDEPLPPSPSFDEDDVSDKPTHMRRMPMNPATEEWITGSYRRELESLLAVDESVGRVIERLEERGVLDRTFVIFTSDNGFFHGQHRFPFSKYFPYEETIRVPLLVRGPGIAPGTSQSTLVSNIDIVPTVLEWTGATPLRAPDGRSLVPLLTDASVVWDRVVFIEGTAPETPGRLQFEAVRSPQWMYTEYSNGERELYDLVTDPFQLENLAADPEFEDVIAQHQVALDALRTCRGVECHDVTL